MIKQQDIANKANEDFVKFKARLMHLGKEQVFQQSDKITFAKKLRRVLTSPDVELDNNCAHIIIDMDNVYDVFYDYYKENEINNGTPPQEELEDLILKVFSNYRY